MEQKKTRMFDIRFVAGSPAALLGTTLIVADLHLGIEAAFSRQGIRMPSSTVPLKNQLLSLIKKTRARELVILGDVKHKVPGTSFQEELELPHVFAGFPVPVTVTPGNHDPGLERLAPEVVVSPSTGFKKVVGGHAVYLSHGHTWPPKSALSCETIVIGHVHPQVEFRDSIGKVWAEPVWVRASLNRKKLEEKYGKLSGVLPQLIIVPSFNTLTGSVPLNRTGKRLPPEPIGPLVKCAEMERAEMSLLDGTYLGKLKLLKKTGS